MALTQRMELRQGQTLAMTPQLQQAIKLLTLSNLELREFVEQELEANPMLENADGAGESLVSEERVTVVPEPTAPAGADPWTASGLGAGSSAGSRSAGRGRDNFDDDRSFEDTVAEEIDLRQHLTTQIGADLVDPTEHLIGLQLIEALDDSGYLAEDLALVAERLGCPLAQVEATLAKLQQFDPPGIFARDLKECLAIQLRDRDRLDPAMQILLDHLHLLAGRDRSSLMKICGVDAEDLAQMTAEIRALNPKPASAFDRSAAVPITPDILLHRHPDGGWIVELNAETLPRVLVDRAYFTHVSHAAKDKSDRDYVTERYRAASWLVKSLHQRATTILRVATEIVRRQDAFLQHGVAHLKPLVRREIAATVELHESTVSRAATGKFMATPRGIFELRYFFGAGLADTTGGDTHAAEAVRSRLRALIEAEAPEAVLSDDALVALLRREGIEIARRTVAKYRESMKISSSTQRRREKSL
jgi:RNA polymerase sigma-54 factor